MEGVHPNLLFFLKVTYMLTNKLPKKFKFSSDQEIEDFIRNDKQIMKYIQKITRTAVRQDIISRVKKKKPISNRFFYAFATYEIEYGYELTLNQKLFQRKKIIKMNERDPVIEQGLL